MGKTTLGLIAATSLRRSFIDADSAFQTLHGPISTFVNAHGWSAFRDAETVILKKLLKEHPRGYVIACGGGVVEREENRQLLQRFKDSGNPIVHVVRDKEETVRYLVDEQARCACVPPTRHSPQVTHAPPADLRGAKRSGMSGLVEHPTSSRSAHTPSHPSQPTLRRPRPSFS